MAARRQAQGRGCRNAGVSSSPAAVFSSPMIALLLPGPLCSLTWLLSRTRVLAPAPSVAETKRRTDFFPSGCITGIPEKCFSNASSLTEVRVFSEPLAAEREGVSAQEQGRTQLWAGRTRLSPSEPPCPARGGEGSVFPARAAPQRRWCRAWCLPLPFAAASSADDCIYSFPHRVSAAPQHPCLCPGWRVSGAGGALHGALSVSAGDQAAWLRTTLCCICFRLNCSTSFLVSSLSF